jgi:hypothetical protein
VGSRSKGAVGSRSTILLPPHCAVAASERGEIDPYANVAAVNAAYLLQTCMLSVDVKTSPVLSVSIGQ